MGGLGETKPSGKLPGEKEYWNLNQWMELAFN